MPMYSRGFSLIQETGPMLPATLRRRALAASGLNDSVEFRSTISPVKT
jgi:hypothetical protein